MHFSTPTMAGVLVGRSEDVVPPLLIAPGVTPNIFVIHVWFKLKSMFPMPPFNNYHFHHLITTS
jgi:hypothetical protein